MISIFLEVLKKHMKNFSQYIRYSGRDSKAGHFKYETEVNHSMLTFGRLCGSRN